MTPLDKFERRYGRYAIPRLHQFLLFGQIFTYLGLQVDPNLFAQWLLVPEQALAGEHWRWVTFLILPPTQNLLGFILHVIGFNFIGSSLEQTWGVLRFNVFLTLGYLATVAAGLFFPGQLVTNYFLDASTLVAFATLFPDVKFLIYFVIPVKAKWVGLLTWIFLGMWFMGPLSSKAAAVACVANYFVFFAGPLARRWRHGIRSTAEQVRVQAQAHRAMHHCHVCGVTDKTDPTMDFRYCSQCGGGECYCSLHIHDHDHTKRA